MTREGFTEYLTEEQCLAFLRRQHVGRLAFLADGRIELFPVDYAVVDGAVRIRNSGGTKQIPFDTAADVVFEVDHPGDVETWSVVVRGIARRVPDGAPAAPRIAPASTDLSRFHRVEIVPVSMTGRLFGAPVHPTA
ncbi:nitroimidazol reductase NimA-like FMN-containing flavoprotein (pyridoxamine 5'-phosphate oxidase superfamily) [Clavibacter michiganensis]|uniref:pyridoxamine 5'-phosphate oxidase family protein n=1 Tax=Clavibacter michiganensis TaxID=28447 RepID=UPI001AE99BE9|nr:pyridoxamine 5'-phosphate oxidase family protein [Clavibacter michiganensis]MBP2459091.1 nitroimidazol reductase NimA-like FMN-containing flavoprotein (pyridoxamine 5'-phosphate oxidase superfamily) [Clavibacter michiganensis]MDQ0411663.1 nitroimidazol reductase NimA-like FMN-containing flavoprotein (pyridoxamine 5'-phosphate oxidase superfamily) [Clavibacter michiganensis]